MNTAQQKVAFLDTNALHFVDLYLQHARRADLYPFVDDKMDSDAITAAKTDLEKMSEKNLKKRLGHGLNVIAWIVRGRLGMEYSPLSELELMAGRLKGRALQNAAAEGVPDRMWGRFREEEIAARLGPEELQEVKIAVDRIGTALERPGIEVTVNPDIARDALDLAKHVAGSVYIAPVDCVIYSHALIVQADFLITSDEYLKKMVNDIKSGASHLEINARLRKIVNQVRLGDVVFPEAKRPVDLPNL